MILIFVGFVTVEMVEMNVLEQVEGCHFAVGGMRSQKCESLTTRLNNIVSPKIRVIKSGSSSLRNLGSTLLVNEKWCVGDGVLGLLLK